MAAEVDVIIVNNDNSKRINMRACAPFKNKKSQPVQAIPLINTSSSNTLLFNALIAWYKKHEAFSGESICQCDEPMIDATNILSNIADNILEFNVEWKD